MPVRLSLCFFLLLVAVNAQPRPGWLAQFGDSTRRVQFVASAPHLYLEANESIHPGLDPAFEGEWSGILQLLANGDYEFSHEIQIDGKSGRRHTLGAGNHPIVLKYRRPAGIAQLRLQWRSGAFDWEPVPRSAMFHVPNSQTNPRPEEGRRTVHDARCANCHASAGLEKNAPSLAVNKTNPKWTYAFLRKHQVIAHSGQQSADLAAHLASLPAGRPAKNRRVNEVVIGKGGELFGTLGCVFCHPSGTMDGLGSKYTVHVLTDQLLASHQPSMLLNEEDATALAAYLTRSTNPAFEVAAPPGDAAAGARLLSTLGCVSCHEQRKDAKPLASLDSAACTKIQPGFSTEQSQSVVAFLKTPAPRSPAPVYDLDFQLRRHQCLACHNPGTEAPPLEAIGEKLKTAWIGEVLWNKKRIRPSRELRMPHYAEAQVKPLLPAFAKAEGLAPGDGVTPPVFSEARRTLGNGMLGTNASKKGMACIGCHDWGEYKSLGEEGPQLINLTTRMRLEYFERWMRNPARILSGTSMPNYFGAQPAERARESIHTLWAGMELGAKAPVPDGYRTGDLEVTSEAKPAPGKDAVIVRWDMPEATPAAIAVGLPGGFSYCFDAGQSRLLYAWRGGFLDMTGTLLRKTDAKKLTPTAALVGDMIWKSEPGFPFAVGAERSVPKRQFKGYRLIQGIPEFHYQLDGMDVYEQLTVSGQSMLRTITIARVDRPVYFEGRLVPQGVNVKVERKLGQ